MRIIRAIFRFFFNHYWHLNIKEKRKIGTNTGWNWIVNTRDEYIGYSLYGYRSVYTTMTVSMYFNKPYQNRDYALVAMMIHWRLYRKGYKLTKDNKIVEQKDVK